MWLDALGYAKPREDSVQVHIGYMTRLYRRRPEHLSGKQAIVMAACRVGALGLFWHRKTNAGS